MPGQHEDVHGDARSIEEIGRQRNDRFHKVAVHKIFPYLLFRAATVEDAGEADNGSPASGGKIAEGVKHKSKIGF